MWTNLLVASASLAAFLGGLHLMRHGLERMAKKRLQRILLRFVRTPTRGIVTGTIVTALLQSSAALTALTVGMVAGRVIAFRDAVGLVLGSNVGSTITPQLLRLDLWVLVVPSLLAGMVLFIIRRPTLIPASMALIGFSTVFIALRTLTTALAPLGTSRWFAHHLMTAGHNAFLAVAAGCAASAVIQSSTATTVVTMAMAQQGIIPLSSGIAIILGANIGTCATSVIAAIGQPREAQQVALSHVLLNVAGVALVLPILGAFTNLIQSLGGGIGQQIANAHTLFNVLSTLLVWPVATPFANMIERLLPRHEEA